MPNLTASKVTQLQSASGLSTTNLDDLERSFYSANSGLTPPNKFSIADHKLAFYKLNGALGKSLAEVERSYFSLSGAQGADYDSLALDFYTNYGYGPKSISGLALWLDSSSISAQSVVSDTFTGVNGTALASHTTDTLQSWVLDAGGLQLSNGTLISTSAGSNEAHIIHGMGNDLDISIDTFFDFTNSGNPDIFAGVDVNNLYAFGLDATGKWFLGKLVVGAFTSLGAGPTNLTSGTYNLRLTVQGTTVTCYLNGTQVASVTDSSITSRPIAGLSTGAVGPYFKNLKIKTLTLADGSPTSVWPDISGNNRHAIQATGTKQPLFRKANPNQLDYDGATFEIGTGNYAAQLDATSVARDTTQHDTGTASLKVTTGATTLNGQAQVAKNFIFTTGRQYTVAARVFSPLGGTFDFRTFTGIVGGTRTIPANTWTTVTLSFTAAGDGGFALRQNPSVATAVFYVDSVIVYDSTLPAPSWVPPVTLPSTGKPAVQFDGVDDVLATVATALGPGITVFAVAQVPGNTAGIVNADGASRLFQLCTVGAGSANNPEYISFTAAGAPTIVDSAGAAGTNWHVIEGSSDGNAGGLTNVWEDGASNNNAVAAAYNNNSAAIQLATTSTNTGFSIVAIAAILIYNRALSTSERQRVERYLKNRFGTP